MKKVLTLILALAALAVLVACGATAPAKTNDFDLQSLKTLGDLQKLEKENDSWAYNENGYVDLFEYGGTTYRVFADLTEEIYNSMEAIDFFDEDREEKLNNILAGVAITKAEDMTQYIPTEEELQKYVGKTGQELLDDDFWTSGYWLYDDQYFHMGHDLYEFDVYFNEKIDVDNTDMDEFNDEEAIRTMTVKKLVFTGFSGRATDIEEPDTNE